MKYVIRFFTHDRGAEQNIKEYNYDHPIIIPRIKDEIIIDADVYEVRKVSMCYDDCKDGAMIIEVMLDYTDLEKEWWE